MLVLRGHHLICLVAFQGIGYSKAFARNFRKLQKIYLSGQKEKVSVVAGPDMACGKCPHLSNDRCVSPADGPNQRIVALDKKAFKLLKIKPGIFTAGELLRRVCELTKKDLKFFCRHCSWHKKTDCLGKIMDFIKIWE